MFCASNVSIISIRIGIFSFTFLPSFSFAQSCIKRILSLCNFSECSAKFRGLKGLQVTSSTHDKSQEGYYLYRIQEASECKEIVYFAIGLLTLIYRMSHHLYNRHFMESKIMNKNCGLITTLVNMEMHTNKKQNGKLKLIKPPENIQRYLDFKFPHLFFSI